MNKLCSIVVMTSLLAIAVGSTVTHAEVVEEIVAWVNGEIITKSAYDDEEELAVGEAYRRYSGEELDRWLEKARAGLLLQMVDRKILVHHAKALGYNIEDMSDQFYQTFKEQQMETLQIESEEEFDQLLVQDGMSVEALKQRLIEMYAPEEVIRFEVTSRISISNTELEAYYYGNLAQFEIPGEVVFREIVLKADSAEKKEQRRAEAEEILARANAGENFSELAMSLSEAGTRDDGGLLGPLKRDDLSDLLADLTFSAPVGQVELVDAPYGFHIVKIELRTEESVRSLEEVRDQLSGFLEERKYRDELNAFLKEARADSEWCVKPKYRHLLSIDAPTTECGSL